MTVIRAAFDVGSGATKLQVAEVDTSAGKIVNVLFAEERPVKFALDLKASKDNTISESIMGKGLQVFGDLLRIASEHGAVQVAAIATEVFRKAANGREFVRKVREVLGIELCIVSQQMEAVLGYDTAVALGGIRDVISWDSGGGSFQLATDRGARVYLGALGASVVTAMMVRDVQDKIFTTTSSPNPVHRHHIDQLASLCLSKLSTPPRWLTSGAPVVAVGGPNSIFRLAADMTGTNIITTDLVASCTAELLGHSDATIRARCCPRSDSDPPSMILPKLTLLQTVMKHCNIKSFKFVPAIGSCAGILISTDLKWGILPSSKL